MKSMRTLGILAALVLTVGFAALATPGGNDAMFAGISASIDTGQPFVGSSPPMPSADLDLNSTTIDTSTATAAAGPLSTSDIEQAGVATLADFKMRGGSGSTHYDMIASAGPPLIDG